VAFANASQLEVARATPALSRLRRHAMFEVVMDRCRYLKSVSVFRYFFGILKVGSLFGIGISKYSVRFHVYIILSPCAMQAPFPVL